jgi:methylated-DNA-[protein]-cysteine S-methyltransferase
VDCERFSGGESTLKVRYLVLDMYHPFLGKEHIMETTPHATAGHAVFETALGFMGIAWSEAGLTRLCLPQRNRDAVERRLLRHAGIAGQAAKPEPRWPEPQWIVELIASIKAYAAGEDVDFSGVPVDLAGVDDFRLAIYDAARKLAFGETTTYGELAKRAGHAGLARETGAALGDNPVPLVIPCHRILAAGGKIGGFSAPGGSATKEKMLAMEGVRVGPPPPAQVSFGF